MQVTREQAWELLNEFTHGESLLKHALAVEAAMRGYAVRYGEDPELWGATGLVHDLDFEQYPSLDVHPREAVRILEERGWPNEIIRAVQGHAPYLGVPRDTPMAKVLFAVDELTGFVIACALVRPDKSLANLEVKSVRKKWKDKAFARAVSREDMEQGASELGISLDEHIAFVIEALKPVAAQLSVSAE